MRITPNSAAATILAIGGFVIGVVVWSHLNLRGDYSPQEGDILFQSLPPAPLVNAIEGSTESRYSHCGIVFKQNDKWFVYEALSNVGPTPLDTFLDRGRGNRFDAFRFREEFRKHIPETIAECKKMKGRPYDARYRMDDDAIYCSELVYKAYLRVTGTPLGKLVKLGELKWEPHAALIRALENGPVPKDREIITPRDLAKAKQFELVYATLTQRTK